MFSSILFVYGSIFSIWIWFHLFYLSTVIIRKTRKSNDFTITFYDWWNNNSGSSGYYCMIPFIIFVYGSIYSICLWFHLLYLSMVPFIIFVYGWIYSICLFVYSSISLLQGLAKGYCFEQCMDHLNQEGLNT